MHESTPHTHIFKNPIDAVSFRLSPENIDLEVRGFDGHSWTPWQTLTLENEQDPTLHESNLVLFPRPVSRIETSGKSLSYAIHPIRVSDAPIRWKVTANGESGKPRILSREEWGADESLLFKNNDANNAGSSSSELNPESVTAGNGDSAVPKRIADCDEAQRQYPDEFKTVRRVTRDEQRRIYRWPLVYSPKIRLLVVHHTAMTVGTDARSPVERVRALYAYHANSRGWGDIGYHYLIDETGQIYEGKAGGPFVVGGHAYCNNTGTIGVAMLGNFEIEKPSQVQMQALQSLLVDLAKRYDIALDRDVRFHGKIMPPIVGHRDLLSTDCPGYYAYGVLAQVRDHVKKDDLLAMVDFPGPPSPIEYTDRSAERKAKRIAEARARNAVKEGLAPVGSMELSGPPGGQAAFSIQFFAGTKSWRVGQGIGSVERSDPGIALWQEKDGAFARVRTTLNLTTALHGGESSMLRLKVGLPREAGDYQLILGPWTYTLHATGRRSRAHDQEPRLQYVNNPSSRSDDSGIVATGTKNQQPNRQIISNNHRIRLRLSYTGPTARVTLPVGAMVNGVRTTTPDVILSMNDSGCITDNEAANEGGIIAIDASMGVTIASWNKPTNRFRGILECRVIAGSLVLINELPLEDYLAGLAEEPDTEPYEKQRAFAIAARTYAAYYLDPAHRKFPGMPYDGDDSPALFQSYGGIAFEESNPRWVKAIRSTAGQVLMKDNHIIRAPYFSSDSGRTRTPEEAGWKDFPFAEIFTSKPDPWCTGEFDRGHGVGMSGCGAKGQANEGKTVEEILRYYYPGTALQRLPAGL